MPEILDEKLLNLTTASPVDSGFETNSNQSSTCSGNDLIKPDAESDSKIFLMPFSPLNAETTSEIAIPMFPDYKSSIEFNPPIRLSHISRPCKDRMSELLDRLPNYKQSQEEIIKNIYVSPQIAKRQMATAAAREK